MKPTEKTNAQPPREGWISPYIEIDMDPPGVFQAGQIAKVEVLDELLGAFFDHWHHISNEKRAQGPLFRVYRGLY